MINSPIRIPLALSQSRTPSDLVKVQAIAADALKIERYINVRMEADFIREFVFSALAADLSMDQERVRSLLSKLAGHNNSITVCNPQKRPRTPVTGRAIIGGSSRSSADVPAWIEPSSGASEVAV